ncbi:uncharacterized protein K441DRAFT_569917, partial [Cenococcum geophilum 1.58]|uniref:uncharacterized protein n=1 Tax=Cenococcum geophilum 1.58 TaxID=794803 RepID=UPI00358DFAB0
AITKLIELTSSSIRFCLFINGLNKYNRDYKELISIIKGFNNLNIKVCVSSWL